MFYSWLQEEERPLRHCCNPRCTIAQESGEEMSGLAKTSHPRTWAPRLALLRFQLLTYAVPGKQWWWLPAALVRDLDYISGPWLGPGPVLSVADTRGGSPHYLSASSTTKFSKISKIQLALETEYLNCCSFMTSWCEPVFPGWIPTCSFLVLNLQRCPCVLLPKYINPNHLFLPQAGIGEF